MKIRKKTGLVFSLIEMIKLTRNIAVFWLPLVLSLAFTPPVKADPDYVCFIQLPTGEFVDLEEVACGQGTSEVVPPQAQQGSARIYSRSGNVNSSSLTVEPRPSRRRSNTAIEYRGLDGRWIRAIQAVQNGAGQSGSFNNPYLVSNPRSGGVASGGSSDSSSLSSGSSGGPVRVRSYQRRDGTRVRSYTRNRPSR